VTRQPRSESGWRALLTSPQPGDAFRVRQLAEAFRDLERVRTDLGALAGPRRRDEPGYRWLKYKEAFSPDLVRSVLDHWAGLSGLLVDPFAGSATSLLVAAERGLNSVGVELLPYAQWGADTVVRANAADSRRFSRLVDQAVNASRSVSNVRQPALRVPAASWAVSYEVSRAVMAVREALPPRGSAIEADLAHLALVSIVENVSMSVKDGTSLRHRYRQRKGHTTRPGRRGQQAGTAEVISAFVAAAKLIEDDLVKMPGGVEARVVLGDARHLPLRDTIAGSAIFSPPYPNRYDYSAIYQLELATGGFVRTPEDLRRIRKALLRSHLEAPAPDVLVLDDPAVLAVLRSVTAAAEGGPGERGRTLRMLVGYFNDMCSVFNELVRVLRPGAPAACVVAAQTFFGYPVPTDVMLGSLAQRAGLAVEELWVLRHKRVAVQQRARGGVVSNGGRESVLLLRRP
jgi:hypothetical protein